eukprot:gene15062-17827_t
MLSCQVEKKNQLLVLLVLLLVQRLKLKVTTPKKTKKTTAAPSAKTRTKNDFIETPLASSSRKRAAASDNNENDNEEQSSSDDEEFASDDSEDYFSFKSDVNKTSDHTLSEINILEGTVLLEYLLANKQVNKISFAQLFDIGVNAFLVTSESLLHTMLVEYTDHGIIQSKVENGETFLSVPIDKGTMRQILKEMKEMKE